MLSFASTHIYLGTYEYTFLCDCLSLSVFAYFCGRNTLQRSRTIVQSCLFLDSFLISSISSPFFFFFHAFHFYVFPYCYFTFLPSPFRFCAFLSFSNLTPKPFFSSLIPKNNQLCTTYLFLLFLLYTHR